MDEHVSRFAAEPDGDLMLCLNDGVAYQRDMSQRTSIDYWTKCAGYEGTPICDAIHDARVKLVNRYVGDALVCDIGIGSGEFIRRRPNTVGYDVDATAMVWLKQQGLLANRFSNYKAFCMWDVLEHVERPADYLDEMPPGAFLFISTPIFDDLRRIRESKHYRPGEHLLYFTAQGLITWLSLHGFGFLEGSDAETRAGREKILSFVFQKRCAAAGLTD